MAAGRRFVSCKHLGLIDRPNHIKEFLVTIAIGASTRSLGFGAHTQLFTVMPWILIYCHLEVKIGIRVPRVESYVAVFKLKP